MRAFFGRVFDNPAKVFDTAMLQPETQDQDAFADGIKNITEAQQRVASEYLEDGSIEDACPPLRALLTIMASGSFEGKEANHPEIRRMFTRKICSQATGIANGSSQNSRPTLHCGSGISITLKSSCCGQPIAAKPSAWESSSENRLRKPNSSESARLPIFKVWSARSGLIPRWFRRVWCSS